ncbi:MAG: nitrous oxide reductase accessory protein NosL [Thermodesulfovibrionales bacterium]|nr:nitrous oxide reductase accessory protein NosL [Thermodesulfovibrionales bacterium]
MKKALLSLAFVAVLSFNAFSQPMEIPDGARCHACGMKVDAASLFSAQIIDTSGNLLAFCDIGDMFISYGKMKEKSKKVYVKDHTSGGWIDAADAIYVKSEKISTPMGWGIAAFKTKEDAAKHGETLTFDAAMDMVGKTKMKMKML